MTVVGIQPRSISAQLTAAERSAHPCSASHMRAPRTLDLMNKNLSERLRLAVLQWQI
jgi:hypothetical protein